MGFEMPSQSHNFCTKVTSGTKFRFQWQLATHTCVVFRHFGLFPDCGCVRRDFCFPLCVLVCRVRCDVCICSAVVAAACCPLCCPPGECWSCSCSPPPVRFPSRPRPVRRSSAGDCAALATKFSSCAEECASKCSSPYSFAALSARRAFSLSSPFHILYSLLFTVTNCYYKMSQ